MQVELDNFIIKSNKPINYIDDIVQTLNNETANILNFFRLTNLKEKKIVKIWDNKEDYKNYLLKYVDEYFEWMCGDTYDGNINLLDIFEARSTQAHKDMTIEEFCQSILHEFVHSCQQEINSNSSGVAWFWEALATNLSKQDYNIVNLNSCDFHLLCTNFNATENCYDYAYTIGYFMLNKFSQNELLEFVKNPQSLKNVANDLFEKIKKEQN